MDEEGLVWKWCVCRKEIFDECVPKNAPRIHKSVQKYCSCLHKHIVTIDTKCSMLSQLKIHNLPERDDPKIAYIELNVLLLVANLYHNNNGNKGMCRQAGRCALPKLFININARCIAIGNQVTWNWYTFINNLIIIFDGISRN